MKKSFFALPLLALFVGACSDSENIDTDNGKLLPEESGPGKYMTVKLVSPASIDTRGAGDDHEVESNEPGGTYEEGTASENQVNLVRFFFFDEEGVAVPVKKKPAGEGYNSYIDWRPSQADNEADPTPPNIEKTLSTTLNINGPEETEAPKLVIAVLNPTADIIALDNPRLSQFQTTYNDYLTGLTKDNFVMSTTVYVDNNNSIDNANPVISYSIIKNGLYETIEEAEDNAIILYVERVVARLDFYISQAQSQTMGEGYYDSGEVDANGNPIYIKLLGWYLTSTPTMSRAMKSINAAWDKNNFFADGYPWNSDNFHRSFWAINPPADALGFNGMKFGYNFYNFYGEDQPNNPAACAEENSIYFTSFGTKNNPVKTYMQENANPYENINNLNDFNTMGAPPTSPTKVFIAAQLVNAQNQTVTICEYAHKKYTLDGLKNFFANNLNLYKRTTSNGTTKYTKIQPSDLTFESFAEFFPGENKPGVFGSYYSYCILTDAASKETWCEGDAENAPVVTDPNEFIYNMFEYQTTPPKIWNEGKTYFFFNIRHLGDVGSSAYDGVVRNHIYRCNLTTIAGLGTPVYNPDVTIYPEEPEYFDEGLISVKVDILTWRVVFQEYTVNW